jgi:hypothetical protein
VAGSTERWSRSNRSCCTKADQVLSERRRVDWSQRPEARAVGHSLAQQHAGAGPEDLVFTSPEGHPLRRT